MPKSPPKSRREANKEATRQAILRAARRLFGRRGYADTLLGGVAKAARVTTGALYHHFADKKDLFQAVAEGVEEEVLKRIGEVASGAATPWQRLMSGTCAMLEICTEPDIRRILFQDAPGVIGAAEWRAVELRFGYGMLCRTLRDLVAAGEIRPLAVEVLAPMILGALIEAAQAVAAAEDQTAALASAQHAISLFLESLRPAA